MEPQLTIRLIMLGLWVFIVIKTAKPFIFSRKSMHWPKILAAVKISSFDRQGNIYSPKIIYHYQYEENEYQNDTYSFLGVAGFTKKQAIQISKEHPEGSLIQIYVDPKQSNNSVVIPGVHWLQYVGFILLTAFCLSVAFLIEILNFIWPGCQPNCT